MALEHAAVAHHRHLPIEPNVASQASPFDAQILYAKLEAAKREQDAAHLRRRKRETFQNSGGGGAGNPAAAADQTMASRRVDQSHHNHHHHHDAESHNSNSDSRRASLPTTTTVNPADQHPRSNPKQMHAALSIGMSESEAEAADEYHAARRKPSPPAAGREVAAGEERRTPQRCLAVMKGLVPEPTTPQQHPPGNPHATRTYRPGDAAQRRSGPNPIPEEPCANTPPPGTTNGLQTKIVPIKSGAHVSYERVGLGIPLSLIHGARVDGKLYNDTRQRFAGKENRDPAEKEPNQPLDKEDTGSPRLVRPTAHHHDRPDWTQASESGEEMRGLLHLGGAGATQRKNRDRALTQPMATQIITTAAAAGRGRGGEEKRGDCNEKDGVGDTLIADAVAKINEEKAGRRRTIAAFFKKM